MKSLKCIIFSGVFILILGAQVFYVVTNRSNKISQIAENENIIVKHKQKLIALDKKLLQLPQTKSDLDKMEKQKTALLEVIPISSNATKDFIELLSLMHANSFSGVTIQQADTIPYEEELGIIIEKKYTLTYISTFAESKKFVENLNASYQLINIERFSIANEIQTDEKEKQRLLFWYADQFNEVVTTTITFSMFARPEVITADEIYLPGFNLLSEGKDVFLKLGNQGEALTVNSPEAIDYEIPVTVNAEDSNGKFKLDIADALTSGDTYKFLGPGRDPNSYIGLVSAENTYITVTIKDTGYAVVLQDEKGEIKEGRVSMGIEAPTFEIFSKMRPISSSVPNVHIYVRNYTSKPIEVTLEGSLLENIHIYNEFDEEVFKGETKGKVRLT